MDYIGTAEERHESKKPGMVLLELALPLARLQPESFMILNQLVTGTSIYIHTRHRLGQLDRSVVCHIYIYIYLNVIPFPLFSSSPVYRYGQHR